MAGPHGPGDGQGGHVALDVALEPVPLQLAALETTFGPIRAALDRFATALPAFARPDPDEAALFQLLLATWPKATLVTTLWDFVAAFAALRSASKAEAEGATSVPARNEKRPHRRTGKKSDGRPKKATTADLAAATRRVLEFPAFISPYFPRKAVRRVIATHGRGAAARRWVVDDVLLPTVVELMQGEVFRPQRVRFDRQWTKIVRGFFRPSRTAAAIPYWPGTIAEVIPAEISSVHSYRWLRQRTKVVAAQRILASAAAPTDPAVAPLVVASAEPTDPELVAQTAAGSDVARLADRELLRLALATLPPLDRELVGLRLAGTPHRLIAERLGLPSAAAACTRWSRLRGTLRGTLRAM